MNMEARVFNEITITDPDTGGEIRLEIYKHQNGGIFAIDSSYLEQCFDEDTETICIPDPFSEVGDEKELYLY